MFTREDIENCFLLSVPTSLVTIATPRELAQEIERTTRANAMVTRFLDGEIDDYELLEFMEQFVPVDLYCENLNENLESWTNERVWEG